MACDYIILKCVGLGDLISARPSRKLLLCELQQLVEGDPELMWGANPRGPIVLRHPNGTTEVGATYMGFSFAEENSSSPFFICHEFYDGIAIHLADDVRVPGKAAKFGAALGAKVFRIEGRAEPGATDNPDSAQVQADKSSSN